AYMPSPAPGYTYRFKIMAFGLLVGGGLAFVYSFFMAILLTGTRPAVDEYGPFAQSTRSPGPNPLLASWVSTFATTAPAFILIAVLDAAADAMIRKSKGESRRTRELVKTLRQGTKTDDNEESPPPDRRAMDIVEPFRREMP